MSGASASTNPSTTKATVPSDTNQTPALPAPKPTTQLEEDDEFEDFPVEDWADEETTPSTTTSAANSTTKNANPDASAPSHLWEESWDDDDTSEDFSQMLREELKKMEGSKR